MKKLLLSILMLLTALVFLAAITGYKDFVKNDINTFSGTLKLDKERAYLVEGKTVRQLLLAPPQAMDSLGIKLNTQDSLWVTGVLSQNAILVSSIRQGDKLYTLRDAELLQNAYDEPSTVAVTPAKCIACKLCVTNCPVGAISMVNGKAVIDSSKCVSCGICIEGNGKFRGCPVRAISK